MDLIRYKILVIGGYGAVGAILSRKLSKKYPDKVLIGGRNVEKAQDLIATYDLDATPVFFDIKHASMEADWLDTVHTVICCVEYLEDDDFINRCIELGINYLELATSYEAYQRLMKFEEPFKKANIVLVPGVGLMPGLSGVFAKHALSTFDQINSVSSFVMLGLGEKHGLDAIRWMLESSNRSFDIQVGSESHRVQTFDDPVRVKLLHEKRPRKFYRFDFGDQHIIKREMPVQKAETRLSFDIRWITALTRVCKKLGLMAWISRINPRTVQRFLNSFSVGSEKFAVQTACESELGEEITYLASGHNEARATAVISAFVTSEVFENKNLNGVKRMEDIISFESFQEYLNKNEIKVLIK